MNTPQILMLSSKGAKIVMRFSLDVDRTKAAVTSAAAALGTRTSRRQARGLAMPGSGAPGRFAGSTRALVAHDPPAHPAGMFVVPEAEAAAIRAVFEQRGEFAAPVELRRLFPGALDNNANARQCARTIAGRKPLPVPPRRAKPLPGRRR